MFLLSPQPWTFGHPSRAATTVFHGTKIHCQRLLPSTVHTTMGALSLGVCRIPEGVVFRRIPQWHSSLSSGWEAGIIAVNVEHEDTPGLEAFCVLFKYFMSYSNPSAFGRTPITQNAVSGSGFPHVTNRYACQVKYGVFLQIFIVYQQEQGSRYSTTLWIAHL